MNAAAGTIIPFQGVGCFKEEFFGDSDQGHPGIFSKVNNKWDLKDPEMIKQYFRSDQDQDYPTGQFSTAGVNEIRFFTQFAPDKRDNEGHCRDQDNCFDDADLDETEAHTCHQGINACSNRQAQYGPTARA